MNRYFALAIFTQLIASTVPSASKIVIQNFPVEPYIALRWTISSLVFGLILLGRREKCVWDPRLLGRLASLGLGAYVLASFGTLYAVKIGGVAFFGLLTLLSPLLVVVFSALVLRERIRANTWIALLVAMGGVLVIVSGKLAFAPIVSAVTAALLVVMAYAFESLAFLYSKPFREKVPLVQYLFVAQAAAALVMWPLCFAMYEPAQLVPPSREVWAAILYVAIVSCVGVFFLWYWLLKHLPGQQLGVLEYFHGLAAAALGVVFFGESLSLKMLLGSLLIFAGLVVVSLPPERLALPRGKEREGVS